MFFGLFFGFLVTASADTDLYNDLMYKAKALLKNEQCRDAEKVTRKLTKEFPTDPASYKLRADVWECVGEHPEKIYKLYEEYLEAGGKAQAIASELSQLDKKLFHLDATIGFSTTDHPFTAENLSVKLTPVFVPDRKSYEVESIRIKPTDNKYSVKGLVPGRYTLEIKSDTALIDAMEIKIEGTNNGRVVKKITLRTAYDEFKAIAKKKNCVDILEVLDKYDNDLDEKSLFQWQTTAKLCSAQQAKDTELWNEVLAFVQKNEESLTKAHKRVLGKYSGIFSVAVVDQYGNSVPTAKIGVRDAQLRQEAQDGVVNFGRMMFQTLLLDVDAGWLYEPSSKEVKFSARSPTQFKVILQKKPSTVLWVPSYDSEMSLFLKTSDNVRIPLKPSTKVEVLLQEHTLEASFASERERVSVSFSESQRNIPLPWAYAVKDGDQTLTAGIIFDQPSVSVKKNVKLDLPEKPTILIQGTVEGSPGEVQSIRVSLDEHPAVEYHEALLQTQERIGKERTKLIVASSIAAAATAITGYFQMNALRAASSARAIDDEDKGSTYAGYVNQTKLNQNAAYGGYVGMGVVYSIWALRWGVSSQQRAQEKKLLNQYSAALEQPISIKP